MEIALKAEQKLTAEITELWLFSNLKQKASRLVMKILETERLILRKFSPNDFASVHSYASRFDNVIYMVFGPNSEEDTRAFINRSICKADKIPCMDYQYAAVTKAADVLIGSCNLAISGAGSDAEIGWIVNSNYWNQGYGAEMGKAMLNLGFEELNLHRILAHCDVENIASYRVMEKLGMRREGVFIEGRPANKLSDKRYGDEFSYAILKDEWDMQRDIEYYNSLPCVFESFIEMPVLSDGVIHLVCIAKNPANTEKKWVPSYDFAICKGSEKIGSINLRIGYTDSLYYGGQIGYGIDEKYRGNGYAVRACRLLAAVAKYHRIEKLLITNDINNIASRRVCEKLGARLVRRGRLPEWHDLYKRGGRFGSVYEWNVK